MIVGRMKLIVAVVAVVCIWSSKGQTKGREGPKYTEGTIEEEALKTGNSGCTGPKVYASNLKVTKTAPDSAFEKEKFTKAEFLGKIYPTADELIKECCDKDFKRKTGENTLALWKCTDERIKEIVEKGVKMDRSGAGSGAATLNVAWVVTLAAIFGGRDNTDAKVTAVLQNGIAVIAALLGAAAINFF